jgi:hypothetical protein
MFKQIMNRLASSLIKQNININKWHNLGMYKKIVIGSSSCGTILGMCSGPDQYKFGHDSYKNQDSIGKILIIVRGGIFGCYVGALAGVFSPVLIPITIISVICVNCDNLFQYLSQKKGK